MKMNNEDKLNVEEAECGYWEDYSDKHDKRMKRMDLRCSVCHERASSFVGSRTGDWWDAWKPNYCPHCGKSMTT